MNAITSLSSDTAAQLPYPYLLFLGDTVEPGFAKTAFGVRDWAADKCVGEFSVGATVTTGLPTMTPAEAYAAGARAILIGVANRGGIIDRNWVAPLIQALEAGLDIISGMHIRLADVPELGAAAKRRFAGGVGPQTDGEAAACCGNRLRTGEEIHGAGACGGVC